MNRSRRRALLVLLLLIPATPTLSSSDRSGMFSHITMDDGLSHSSVYHILQDRTGFMWFGTADGLNRFDGYHVVVYRHRPLDPHSISSNTIRAIAQDSSGNLWIGTDHGLNRYDPVSNRFTRFLHRPGSPRSIRSNTISAIGIDRNGTILIGTTAGVDLFDPATHRFTPLPLDGGVGPIPDQSVRSIHHDRNGVLWVATHRGVHEFTSDRRHSRRYTIPLGRTAEKLYINQIFEDGREGIWLPVLSDGLWRFDRRSKRFHREDSYPGTAGVLGESPSFITEDGRGHLWVTSVHGGLLHYDRSVGQWERFVADRHDPTAIISDYTYKPYVDRSGNLWVACDGGVSRMAPPSAFRSFGLEQSILGADILRAIVEDENEELWIATAGGGIVRYDRTTDRWRRYTHDPANAASLSGNDILSLHADRKGYLWVGIDGNRLDRLDIATGRVRHFAMPPTSYDTSPTSILRGYGREIWIGTRQGIFMLHDPDDRGGEEPSLSRKGFSPSELNEVRVTTILLDRTDGIWIGTYGRGLARYDRRTDSVSWFTADPTDPRSLSNPYVIDLLVDRNGSLWVGTQDGLNRLGTDRRSFTRFGEKEGLPHSRIMGMVEDRERGTIWISTLRELVSYSPTADEGSAFTTFGLDQGLAAVGFSSRCRLRDSRGNIIFGGNGLTLFDPDSVRRNPHAPPVVITDIRIFDEPAPLGRSPSTVESLTLSYEQNLLSFEFAALEYSAPEANRYAYKLEGVDKKWVESGTRRFARYTHLAPGEYVFRVRASNNDGVWNTRGARLRIVIVPPFWTTPWFIALVVVTSLSLFALLVRMISQSRLRRRLQLLEQERAMERDRARISRNMHDEIGADLTRIAFLSRLVDREKLDPASAARIDTIVETSRNVIDNIGEIIWAIDPTNDTLDNLAFFIREHVSEYFQSAEMECRIDYPDTIPTLFLSAEVRRNLFLVVKEAAHNLVKHSDSNGAELLLRIEESTLRIVVADRGIGFAADDVGRFRNGLGNMRQRMADIDGHCLIESSPGNGTRVVFTVPIGPKE